MVAALSQASLTRVERSMRSAPLLEDVPTAGVRQLAKAGSLMHFLRGTYLFHQGEKAPDVYFLFEGRVEISSVSATGHKQLHTVLDPPQLFGELGVLARIPRTTSAVAVEDSMVATFPGDAFLEFLASQPKASLALLGALARQVQSHESLVEDLLFLDLKGRVAKRLLGMVSPSFDELPKDGAVVPSVVTHSDLANLAGGSRENVTRILSEFQRRGLVTRDARRYVLKDINGLRRLAGV
jgi:CRP-like cAMP-binding protein